MSQHDLDATFKVKGQGHQPTFVDCSSHYIIYMDDTIIITRARRCLSIMNHAGCRRQGEYGLELGCSMWRTGAYRAALRTACLR